MAQLSSLSLDPLLSVPHMIVAPLAPLLSFESITNACPNCRSPDKHFTVFPDRRAFDSAGKRMLINSAMIPMTTSSSTRVNARVRCEEFVNDRLLIYFHSLRSPTISSATAGHVSTPEQG